MDRHDITLEPTGERMILEHYTASPEDYVIYLLHLATYRFAEPYCRGKRVLDFGCGSGYGSAQIAATATAVHAVDVAADAIDYARGKYARDNLEFHVVGAGDGLPFPDGHFDVVLSFQVFEHVRDADRYLSEARRVLAPHGRLILVTPDRSTRLLPGQRPWNRWHVHEYGARQLERVMRRHFAQVEVLGMGGRADMLDIELRRCRRLKWLSLPFTLPFLPDAWRVAALNLIHRVRGRGVGRAGGGGTPPRFGVEDVVIGASVAPSVNLVAIARKDV